MKITSCLLKSDNEFPISDKTIGKILRENGKIHLWNNRPHTNIDTLVIHYISACNILPDDPYNLEAILGIFCDYSVSSHYLIDRGGEIFLLVPESKRAWHCGGSIMPEPDNRVGVNDFSIGVELIGMEDNDFTDRQYEILQELADDIEERYGIPFSIVGHTDIAGTRAVEKGLRKAAKTDPGPHFYWNRIDKRHFC